MNIVELLQTTGDRHLTATERDRLRDCARQVEAAVRVGAAVEAVESSVVEEVIEDLGERYPRFGQLQPQAWERLAADLQLVLRHNVRALRLGDSRSLDDAVLSYLASVYVAYRLSRGFVRECFTQLRDRLSARLNRDVADELRPYLDRNIEVLAAGPGAGVAGRLAKSVVVTLRVTIPHAEREDYYGEESVAQPKTNPIVCGNIAAGAMDRLPGAAVAWPHELLRALHRTLSVECGPAAESILRNAGEAWGRQLGQRMKWDLANYHELPLNDIPAARVAASLESGFAKHGWGRMKLDFERHATGLIQIAVINGLSTIWTNRNEPVGDLLLAGTLAGLFSELAGLKLECMQTDHEVPGSAPARFVIGLPERLAQAADMARQCQPHNRIVEFLESTQV